MPELRGMRAVVQFFRQSAEPCAAPPTSPFMALDDGASSCQGTGSLPALFVRLRLRPPCCSAQRRGVLLTQDQANQSVDLPRFPQLKPLFQLGVSVHILAGFQRGASKRHLQRQSKAQD